MFAKIIDSQGNLVTVVNWTVVTQNNDQLLDRFIDSNGNVYFERPHNDKIDGFEIIKQLRVAANKFYQIQEIEILIQ